jgi:hypothetical protein
MNHFYRFLMMGVLLLTLSVLAGSTIAQDTIPQPPCGTESGEGCSPESERIDLIMPSFSNPTNISHPLFPVSLVEKTLGHVDGLALHVEYTLLPDTKTIEWNGEQIETRSVQYIAHKNGRIVEVALDWYAQDDTGAVWYFGEDVSNYEDGEVADKEGTWLAGTDGAVAMIMPANPQVGDVYRVENIPGIAFEEITIMHTGLTINGPFGPVEGGIIVQELHMDGEYSNKTFAPSYGEFVTTNQHELEAVALALPTDARLEPLPAELETLSSGADILFEAATSEDWDTTVSTLNAMTEAWDSYRINVPKLLEAQMSNALIDLIAAVDVRQPEDVRRASVEVALSGLDIQLIYRPIPEVEIARFEQWTRQVVVDAAADDPAGVASDVTTLEWTWDRLVYMLDGSTASAIEAMLVNLRVATDDEDMATASDTAEQVLEILAVLNSVQSN